MSDAEKARAEKDIADKKIYSEKAGVLGTSDLSPTNSQYIAALNGSIEGQDKVKFTADSHIQVFKFRFDEDTNRGQKIKSYLAAGEQLFDSNGNLSNEAQEEDAGLPDGTYDKYLKFVSRYDLEAYGATATGQSDADGNPIYSWGNEPILTADGEPLKLLTGETIIKEGWYDYTQVEEGGDGARYITNDAGRIVGVELNFTANMFGDKEPGDDFITDPGATVGTETIEDTPENSPLLAQLEQRLAVTPAQEIEASLSSSQALQIPEDGFRGSGQGTGTGRFDRGGQGGSDGTGNGNAVAAMGLGEGPGAIAASQAGSTSSGEGDGQMSLSQALNSFLGEGEGLGNTDAQGHAPGQGAEGQGAGSGGDAALGEDQSPDSQRKRGLLLQPMMKAAEQAEQLASNSRLLKNLSEGTLLGTNLMDALALGAGVLYALYAPKAVETSRKGFRGLIDRFRNQVTGSGVKIPEKQVLSICHAHGKWQQTTVAAKVGMGTMEVVAQQDLPAEAGVNKPGSQTQVDYAVKQLVNKLAGRTSDVVLIGPQLNNQRSLLENIAAEARSLETSSLVERIQQCTTDEIKQLRAWLDKPSSTPPESSPVYKQMMGRMQTYGDVFGQEQASMASLIELSIALGWSDAG